MEIFYVLIPIRYDVTAALGIKNRLEMICDSCELYCYNSTNYIMFECEGEYQRVKDIMGGRDTHMKVFNTSGWEEYKCLNL